MRALNIICLREMCDVSLMQFDELYNNLLVVTNVKWVRIKHRKKGKCMRQLIVSIIRTHFSLLKIQNW